jgi:hypothetical protein
MGELIRMVDKIQVLDKTIELPKALGAEDFTKDNFLSILRELDPEAASKLENTQFNLEFNEDTVTVVRTGAVMG